MNRSPSTARHRGYRIHGEARYHRPLGFPTASINHHSLSITRSSMKRIARSVGFSLVGFAFPTVLSLAAIPVIVRGLGEAAYGVQALLVSLVGYLSVFNTVQVASTKYLAQYLALNDHDNVAKLLATSLLFNLCVGLLGGVSLFLLATPLVRHVFTIPASLAQDSVVAFRLAALGFFLSAVSWTGSSVLAGMQRFDWLTGVTVAVSTLGVVGSVGAIALGMGLVGVVGMSTLSVLVSCAMYGWLVRRLLPGLRWAPAFHKPMLKRVFLFGMYSSTQAAFGAITVHLDRMLLGIWSGMVAVTTYSIPASVAGRIHQFCASALDVIMPVSSALNAQQREDRLQQLFVRAQNLDVVFVFLLAVPLLTLAPDILGLWIGQAFAERATVVFRLLVVAYGLLALNVVVSGIVAGLGHPEVNTVFSLVLGVGNLVGYWLFIPRWGVNGAGVASLLGSLISLPGYFWYVNRKYLKVSFTDVFQQAVLRPLLAAVLTGAALLVARPAIRSLPLLLVAIVAGWGLYLALTVGLGVWTAQELAFARQAWRTRPRPFART